MTVSSIGMIAAVLACFIAAVLNLALESRFRLRMTRAALVMTICIGAFFYGYGYGWTMGFHFTALVRALLALCKMFGGFNDLASIQEAPVFRNHLLLDLFWLGHFLGFYVTASTTIAALGERLLRRIRATLLRRGPLLLVFGVNARAVAYGRRMAREKKQSVVFVDPDDIHGAENNVKGFGAVLEKDDDALAANGRFLRRLNMKPGTRRIELAVLHDDGRKNLEYARKLLRTMTERGIRPEQTRLLASGIGNQAAELQNLGGSGYGSVYAFDPHELTVRMILRDCPPCGQIRFDDTGKAAEDFHAVIVGFGRMGRAMLAGLVMNGQFSGSRFRADIFDPGVQNGFLHDHPVMKAYDIRFHAVDGRDDAFYAFLEENRAHIRMIALCTGSNERNHEIADDIASWFPWNEKMPLTVYAAEDCYFRLDENRSEVRGPHFFDSDGLDLEEMDAVAMQVNQVYCEKAGSTLPAAENWARCGYRDRQSCRACADFYPAVLRAAGKTAEQVAAGEWPPDRETLENLSVTEHMRWCAFQYATGYGPMPADVWERRAGRYRAEKAGGKTPEWRISRDDETRQQACLVPWEELDELSRRENEATGGQVDYKQMDRDNVLVLSRVLAAKNHGNGDAEQ